MPAAPRSSRPIILASASPRRSHLLERMGLRFRVVPPPDVQERLSGDEPAPLALENAQRKAGAVATREPDALVIGADTIVVLDGEIFGKPVDLADAERMLGRLVGRQHEVFTAVCVICRADEIEQSFCERTPVTMRSLDTPGIRDYLAKIDPLDKAGSYAIQEHGAGIIERIDGSFANVMGLPVERLRELLRELGIESRVTTD